MEIEGRSAVVVGGGSGVGRGVAHALVRVGMDVVVAGFDSARDTCLTSCANGSRRALHVDATDPDSLAELVRHACPNGSLDVLVTTVGAIEELGIDELTDVHWGWAGETGSGAGLPLPSPSPASAVYPASKHSLTGYAEVLRTALAEEVVGVTLLVPSGIAGNVTETSARSRRKVPRRRDGARTTACPKDTDSTSAHRKAPALRAATRSRLRQNRCHEFDLHPGNVLLRDADLSRPVVIDWSTAALGAPGLDVARTALILARVALAAEEAETERARLFTRQQLEAFLCSVDSSPLAHLETAMDQLGRNPFLTDREVSQLPPAGRMVSQVHAGIARHSLTGGVGA